jgi:hypothetical protein
MKMGDRVVIVDEEYKGELGTIYRYDEDTLMVEIVPDYIEEFGMLSCKCRDLIVIDDITNAGEIEYNVGMKVYDLTLNMVCEILEVQTNEDLETLYKVKYENGKVDTFPFLEEGNFIVLERGGYGFDGEEILNPVPFL